MLARWSQGELAIEVDVVIGVSVPRRRQAREGGHLG